VTDHDWEEVPLEPTTRSTSEFEVPSREDPSLLQRVSVNLELNWVYARKVGESEDGSAVLGRITSLRRCRACLQESTNGEEPEEGCGARQVRRVMEE